MVQLKDSLPVYFTDIYEVDAILGVVSKEIDRLYGVIYAAFDNLSASRATGAFEKWENDLGLSHYVTDSERKQAILATLGLIRTQTVETITGIIRAYARNAEIVVKENGYEVAVRVSETGECTSFRQLKAQIERALPYHLSLDFSAESQLEAGLMRRKMGVCVMEMEVVIE